MLKMMSINIRLIKSNDTNKQDNYINEFPPSALKAWNK